MIEKLHVLKEYKHHPPVPGLHTTKYAIAHCGVQFSIYSDPHSFVQDVERRVRDGYSLDGFCEACLESEFIQMRMLEWAEI